MDIRSITLLTAFICAGAAMASFATPQETSIAPLISFESPAEARAWRTVNDDVMGGRSLGAGVVEEGRLVFTGSINTKGGGFSSVRREMEPGALEGARAFVLSIKSDGRAYQLIARTNARFGGRYVSYQAAIQISPEGGVVECSGSPQRFRPKRFRPHRPRQRDLATGG